MKYLKVFEKFNNTYSTSAYDLIDQLYQSDVEEYYNNNYDTDDHDRRDQMDDDYLIEYHGIGCWYYVDDEKFVDNFIIGEVENAEFDSMDFSKKELIDFIEYNCGDDCKETIITKYVEDYLGIDEDDEEYSDEYEKTEEKEIADLLEDFEEDVLKDILSEQLDETEFLREYYTNLYDKSDAKDILRDFGYNVESISIFKDDEYSITEYMDFRQMQNDYYDENPYEEDFDTMLDVLADNLDSDYGIQKMVYENDNSNAVVLAENGWAEIKLLGEEEFQRSYIETILEEEEIPRNQALFIFNKMKKFFIAEGATLNSDLCEEYNLDDLIEADKEGMISNK